MGQIFKTRDLIRELERIKNTKKMGLVTGRFDILHTGHISFLRQAKSKVDILIVGIDSDEAIRKSLSQFKPVHTQKDRAKVLSELRSVDYVLLLDSNYSYKSAMANDYYDRLAEQIRPDYIITSIQGDIYWKEKERRANSIGSKLLICESELENPISSQVINLVYN